MHPLGDWRKRTCLWWKNDRGDISPIFWKSKTIRKVCKSTKSAETRAAEKAVDESIYLAKMIHEIYTGVPNNGQIPVEINLDAQSLLDSIQSTKQLEEKTLSHIIAAFKQNLEDGEVRSFNKVGTEKMYADILTKPGVNPGLILDAIDIGTSCPERIRMMKQ